MELLKLASAITPKSFDADKRTFEVLFYSGESVVRYDWWKDEEYDLQFKVSEESVDLSRLRSGAPFLKDHWATLEDTIGVVEDAWLKSGKAYARVRLSERDDVAPIAKDIADGIIRSVSMGSVTLEKQDERDKNTGRRKVTATKWMPLEISAVPIPADPKAQILSAGAILPEHAGAAREILASLFDAYKPTLLTQATAMLRLEAMNQKGTR